MSPGGGDDLGGIPYCQKRIPATTGQTRCRSVTPRHTAALYTRDEPRTVEVVRPMQRHR